MVARHDLGKFVDLSFGETEWTLADRPTIERCRRALHTHRLGLHTGRYGMLGDAVPIRRYAETHFGPTRIGIEAHSRPGATTSCGIENSPQRESCPGPSPLRSFGVSRRDGHHLGVALLHLGMIHTRLYLWTENTCIHNFGFSVYRCKYGKSLDFVNTYFCISLNRKDLKKFGI